MQPCLYFITVTQQLFTSYLCIFNFQKQLTKDFLLLCAPPTLKIISGVQRVKTTEVKAKCPRPSFPAACVLGLHFHLLCPDSCYLQVCFDMPTAVPAVFLFNSELAFKSFKTLMHARCRRGMQEITPIYMGGIFCCLVPHLLQNGDFFKDSKVS